MKAVVRPIIDEDSRPYWAGLKAEKLKLQKCHACSQFRFPVYPNCPHCGQEGGDWQEVSGCGRLYSWITVHHPVLQELADEVPFTVAMVELAEGPRVTGRMVGEYKGELVGGLPVQAVFEKIDNELTLVNFVVGGVDISREDSERNAS